MNIFENQYFNLFLIISIGLIIGKIRLKKFSFDFSAVIFVALIFGHYGIKIPSIVQNIGLVLFIFTIGIQTGPSFFRTFKKNGLKFISLTLLIVSTGALTILLSKYFFSINTNLLIGIFNGSLTSTPGLAAAVEVTKSPLSSIGYGISYPFGVIGVMIFISVLPRILKIDFKKVEAEYFESLKDEYPEIITKSFIVENKEFTNIEFSELKKHKPSEHCIVTKIKRKDNFIIPHKETLLFLGDIIKVVGTIDEMVYFEKIIGKRIDFEFPYTKKHSVQWILITNKTVVNKKIGSLNLFQNFNASIAILKRSGINITPDNTTHLRFGDRILVAADEDNYDTICNLFGNDDKRLSETDFLPITLGIVLGLIIGSVSIPMGFTNFKLGITGGVLAAALILSGIGKTGPIIWTLSSSANLLIRELGLLLFLASVGCEAGSHLVDILKQNGIELLIIGIITTILPMLIGWWFGTKILKINKLSLLGLITGAMTSTPGLGAANKFSDKNITQVAYAAVYPFALVLMIIFSKIIYYL